MKSKLLFLLLFFMVGLAQAQNWAPIKTGQTYLYGIHTKLPPFGQIGLQGRLIIPVLLDTLSQSPSTGYVFGAKDTLYKDKAGKWIGAGLFSNSLSRSASGEYKISNVTFLPNVAEGLLIARFQEGVNITLRGYATQKRTGLVLGQPDSMVNIRWVAATGLGTHPLANDSSFILSKQFGLVQYRNFGYDDHFTSDPYSFFYGYFAPDQFSRTAQLEGIPHLQLGMEELDSPKKPTPGDMKQVRKENHFDFMPNGGPCISQTGHTFEVYQERCTDTTTDSQGNFSGTWRWTRGFCDSSFSPPIQATDSGTIGREINYMAENVAMLSNKIGYYPSQSLFGRVFSGQFKAETGIGFRFSISRVIDAPDALQILTHPWADMASTGYANSYFWWNSSCPPGPSQPFIIRIEYPSYLKMGTHVEGELLLISSVADSKHLTSLRISPNPATTHLRISSPEKVRKLFVVNALGKVVMQGIPDGEGKITIGQLPTGVYLVRWFGQDGESGTERLLKE